MFKRFCKFFVASAFGLPLLALCCMFLLWLLGSMGVGFFQPVRSAVFSAMGFIPFAGGAAGALTAAYFSPRTYIDLVFGGFATNFLSAFFLGGVMYLIDGFLSKRRGRDSVKLFAKIFGLVVGSLILRFTNLMGELTAIVTRYALVVVIILLVLILSRVLFVGLRAFSIRGIFKTLLQTVVNAFVAVALGCYAGVVGSLAVMDIRMFIGNILYVCLTFLIGGFVFSVSMMVDKLVSEKL